MAIVSWLNSRKILLASFDYTAPSFPPVVRWPGVVSMLVMYVGNETQTSSCYQIGRRVRSVG